MKKILSIVVVFSLLVLASASADSLTNSTSQVNISTSGNTMKIDQATSGANQVGVDPLNTITADTTVASTSAVTVTAQTGRTYIEISAGDGGNTAMSNQIWVGVGTSTVSVGTGRLVTQDNPLRLPADDGVVFSTIASEAVPMCIIQGKY